MNKDFDCEILNGELVARETEVKFQYIASLDGVRAVAVLLVFFFHASLIFPFFKAHFQGGFLGVDVFFVLSGFLITSILLQEFDRTEQINFKKFYLRRFLRLMPAFWLYLVVSFFFARRLFSESSADQLYSNNNFIYALFYLTNWQRAFNGSEIAGLVGHTWSLAIEEQFYLLWAGILFLMLTRLKRNSVVFLTATLICATALFRAFRWHGRESVDYLYNAFDSRMDALLVGCLVSQIISWKMLSKSFLDSRLFSIFAMVCLLIAVVIIFNLNESYNSAFLYLGGFTIFALAIGVIVAWLAHNSKNRSKNYLRNFLETKPLIWLGKTSYGFYLWHSAAISFVFPIFGKPLIRLLAAFALSLLLTAISYYLIELPFLKLKEKFK
jgi:peptidoglycan/LPS O-acetylase OafA/YrhL